IVLGSASRIGGTGTLTLNGDISGAFNLTKVGAGIITLDGNNTYGGTNAINAGTLSLTNINGLGNSTVTSVVNGATLDLAFSNNTLNNTNTMTLNGANALRLTGSNITVDNPLTLAGNTTIIGAGTGLITFSGLISGASDLTF